MTENPELTGNPEVTDNPELVVTAEGGVLEVVFARPHARNAMTWAMYEGLAQACERVKNDPSLRVMVLRGQGERAFVAGTDIAQFEGFDGAAGVAYESRISEVLDTLLAVPVPVVASVRGFCVGAGLAIAACADLRVADRTAQFGVPIARTLGNTLSAPSIALLSAHLGGSRTASLLLTARMMDADEAEWCGFVTTVADDLDEATSVLVERLLGSAPLTLWATKELLGRVRSQAAQVDDEDVLRRVYGSSDFAGAVAAFRSRTRPEWRGE